MLEVPEIINLPPKLLPLITDLGKYRYFLIEGGRASAKSQSIARFILYLCEHHQGLRVVCGREIQNRLEESVHALLSDLIGEYNLNFEITKTHITHKVSGAKITFRGFKELGITNTRGMEGVDILWIDEAQQIQPNTLKDLIPTIRKENAKIFFTMNRYMVDDAVFFAMAGRDDCLHITINYVDNPHCPASMIKEAMECKAKSEREYNHTWLGLPLPQGDWALFNSEHLYKSLDIKPFGDLFTKQRVLGIDFAAQGSDMCVATLLERQSAHHWSIADRIAWDEPDGMASVGKIVNIIGQTKPNVAALDVGGMGHIVHNRLVEVGVNIHRFDGASTEGIDSMHYVNARAQGYWMTKEWFENGFLCLDRQRDAELLRQLERINMKPRSDGRRLIEPKDQMKKNIGRSPDDADSLMIAIYAAMMYLGKTNNTISGGQAQIRRVNHSYRRG